MDLAKSITQGLTYLQSCQAANGSFTGRASSVPDDFRVHIEHPSPFFSAVILTCLQAVPEANQITRALANYLMQQKHSGWTWNYWEDGSWAAKEMPYPDDLDDTAYALAALSLTLPGTIDGHVLGSLAQTLTCSEAALGGPYQTWLVDLAAHPTWYDVDLAVNANIAYLLSLHGVQLPSLQSFFESAIKTATYQSSYYCGPVPVLYFLSRLSSLQTNTALQKVVSTKLKRLSYCNALELSLLLSSGYRLGLRKQLLQSAVQELLNRQSTNGSWPAFALYDEPKVHGVSYFAGSAELTTAFAIEALQLSQAEPQAAAKLRQGTKPAKVARLKHMDTADRELDVLYQQALHTVTQRDRDGQIGAMAHKTAQALGATLPEPLLEALDRASTNGWIAYTIYDDIWDGESALQQLGVANVALRRCVESFRQALPDLPAFNKLVSATLMTVDAANTWESVHARLDPAVGMQSIVLPNYQNYQQLANRSWGHSLAACGVFLACGESMTGRRMQSLRAFFRNFIIARQLNDDAHDWQEDLQAGRLTAVVTMLYESYREADGSVIYDPQNDVAMLQERFWRQTIDDVAERIFEHIASAQTALEGCQFADSSLYQAWLDRLQRATEQALHERTEAQKFILAYGHV